jgi:hypothetical protein
MNYEKLIKDYQCGKLGEDIVLYVDNDGGYLSVSWEFGERSTDDEIEKLEAEFSKEYGDPSGYADIVNILRAAGVNADWV